MSELIIAWGLPSGVEWLVVVLIALVLFGRRLPEVARSVGKSIVEFKKGMKDVKTEINDAAKVDSDPPRRIEHKPDSAEYESQEAADESKRSEESESTTPR